jgi:hypothetical protein
MFWDGMALAKKRVAANVAAGKEILAMRYMGSAALFCILCASLAGCTARENHRIIYQRHAGYNYCHTKVETSGDPQKSNDGEIIDYYGPCDAFD